MDSNTLMNITIEQDTRDVIELQVQGWKGVAAYDIDYEDDDDDGDDDDSTVSTDDTSISSTDETTSMMTRISAAIIDKKYDDTSNVYDHANDDISDLSSCGSSNSNDDFDVSMIHVPKCFFRLFNHTNQKQEKQQHKTTDIILSITNSSEDMTVVDVLSSSDEDELLASDSKCFLSVDDNDDDDDDDTDTEDMIIKVQDLTMTSWSTIEDDDNLNSDGSDSMTTTSWVDDTDNSNDDDDNHTDSSISIIDNLMEQFELDVYELQNGISLQFNSAAGKKKKKKKKPIINTTTPTTPSVTTTITTTTTTSSSVSSDDDEVSIIDNNIDIDIDTNVTNAPSSSDHNNEQYNSELFQRLQCQIHKNHPCKRIESLAEVYGALPL